MSWRRGAVIARVAHAAGLLGVVSSLTSGLGAQGSRRVDPNPAEVAIAAGRLDDAERILFEASRRTPREPSARGALGAFLAARGKLLVGATLLEEAMFFGGDSAAIQSRLFEIYRWAGLFDRAAALRHSRASQVEREAMARAGRAVADGERMATVPMAPNEGLGIGRITLTVEGERVEADIQPLGTGLVLPSSMQLFGAIEVIGAHGDTTFGVARAISIGGVTLGPVPVMLVPSLRTARVGLDLLGLLHPTFDLRAQTLTVRTEAAERERGRELPFVLMFPGVQIVVRAAEAPVGLHTAAARSALRGTRWTLGTTTGAVGIER